MSGHSRWEDYKRERSHSPYPDYSHAPYIAPIPCGWACGVDCAHVCHSLHVELFGLGDKDPNACWDCPQQATLRDIVRRQLE